MSRNYLRRPAIVSTLFALPVIGAVAAGTAPATAQQTEKSALKLTQLDARAACTHTQVPVSRPTGSQTEDGNDAQASQAYKQTHSDRVTCITKRIFAVSHAASEVTGGPETLDYITVSEKRMTEGGHPAGSYSQGDQTASEPALQDADEPAVNAVAGVAPRELGEDSKKEGAAEPASRTGFERVGAHLSRRTDFDELDRFDPQKGNGDFYTGVAWIASFVTGEEQ